MRFAILLAASLVIGCGNDGGEKSPEAPANDPPVNEVPANEPTKPDVIRINPKMTCSSAFATCDVDILVDLTGGATLYGANSTLVASYSENSFPAACDQTSASAYYDTVRFELKQNTKYFFRVCLFYKDTAAYSPGLTLEYKTGVPTP